ncbi:hypothetical protein R3W88_024244 [Solanum pinnatisectum]|uniref:Uncharacterized protein n=1 Tax=Solanum pinnatisectum TaxID=50273 RepID=A0AAV9M021_9SOLN|nr:hypothetical protein R3W88_024244 [Solanum pinnatisectum]
MVQGLPEIHTKNKVENTSIVSLDVSNQEEDEEEEDVPQGGEKSGTKMLIHIYQRCNFSGVGKENYEEAIKNDCVIITKEREVVSLKWIYKTKLNQEGDIQKHKRKAKFSCSYC